MKLIPLRDRRKAVIAQTMVDDGDYDALSQHRWCRNHCGYVYRVFGYGCLKSGQFMHRSIMTHDPMMEVDHIDRNPLNNQRSNLRVCTRAENARNRGLSMKNKSGVKGVFFEPYRGRFLAQIKINNRTIFLGRFKAIDDAATAYRDAAIKYHGEFASPSL